MNTNLVLLTGSSGLIGTSLIRALTHKRISILSLHRSSAPETGARNTWDPYAAQPMSDPEMLEGITAAVHLSGVNLSGRRWRSGFKREILESRVTPTRTLAGLLAGLNAKPEVLVCASAIGFYGSRKDEILTETSLPGSGFLAEVCQEWEEATRLATNAGIRVVHLRFGVVLSREGGALAQMLPVFRAGLGGRLGSGGQWVSWISLPDTVRAIEFAVETTSLSGAVNVVAPNPVTNLEFTRALGHALHRPTLLPAPAFALEWAFGEMAQATLLASQRVLPANLSAAGFQFEYPGIEAALRAVLPPSRE